MIKILAPIAIFFIIINSPHPENMPPDAWKMSAILLLMLYLWISETIPLPVTALIPIVLMPILGITTLPQTTAAYAHPVVFLLFGGFVLALAMRKAGLPKRIVLLILQKTGTRISNIILGFMIATAIMSMWISNTATTAAMLPIALSLLTTFASDKTNLSPKAQKQLALTLMLAIAYAANIGGTATLIGTAPNALFAAFLNQETGAEISFLQWMSVGVPFMLVMLALAWILLVFVISPNKETYLPAAQSQIRQIHHEMGAMNRNEIAIACLFGAAVFFWMFRTIMPFPTPGNTGIAIAAAILCFAMPIKINPPRFLLQWDDMTRIPWGVLVLFGGGLALATGMSQSGLASYIGSFLSVDGITLFLILLLTITLAVFLTEVMSNTALVSALLPVMVGVALYANTPLAYLAMPLTLASSCAFMLPTATPPNAIIFAGGQVRMTEMIRAGFVLNLVAVAVTMMAALLLVPRAFP